MGGLAGFVFSIPALIYIVRASYESSWLLFLGSFLFLIVIWIHTFRDSSKRQHNESTISLAFASHVTTLVGVVVASLLAFILLTILVPGYLSPGMAEKTLADVPVNNIHDKTNGLSFEIFMAATVINFSVGSFTGIVLPFAVKRNQKKDARDPAPLHQQGSR